MVLALAACAAPGGRDKEAVAARPTPASGGEIHRPGKDLLTARPRLEPIFRFDTNPRQLMGMSGPQVAGLLGAPSLLRRDPPVEVWQYAGRDCVLFVYIYESRPARANRPSAASAESGAAQVDHVEIKPRNGRAVSTHECMAALMQRAGGFSQDES